MKRLLCIVGSMNMGGAETFLMKVYRTIDRTKYQMDFAVAVEKEGVYDHEILSLGGMIHHITPKSEGIWKNFSSIKNLVKREKYNYVLRVSQHSLSALELFAAKIGGADVRAFRSSNSNACAGKINSILHSIFMFMPRSFANRYIAPSTEAAEFMFGRYFVKSSKVCILHNAVNHSLYAYSELNRTKIRAEFGVSDSFVIGHIGRFNHQKNHIFLLKIFTEILQNKPTAKLILVGKGEKEDELKDLTQKMGIDNKVIFVSPRININEFYSAFDVLIFPSKFEGMPNVLIEAQAASLPCIASDTITKEAEITKYLTWLSLNDTPTQWSVKAIEMSMVERISTLKDFIDAKYEVKNSAEEFCKLIFE
ncbi:MAG: glycosyltransferase family 1 protein [Bacteroidota bacterium]|nr:glycosyltransferase family 1 protein [Bacteroidota bacterium]